MRCNPRVGGLVAAAAVAVALAGCGDSGDSARGGGATTVAAATTTPRAAAPTTTLPRPAALGRRDHRLRLKIGGQQRRFLLHIPPGHRRSARLPLVIVLHMGRTGADGKVMRDLTGLDATADRERFLVAYPDGLDGRWNSILCCNDTDDVGFIRGLVDQATLRWDADPDRVYATGASNGAAMSYRLAAALPGVFAAIAPVSGALTDIDVREGFPSSPVSLVASHGRQDTAFESMQDGVAAWRRHAGCSAPRVEPYGSDGKVTRASTLCRDGTEVVVYELADMGHAWPGSTADDSMAAPDTPVSANDLLWRFFERHPRRRD